MEALIQKVKYTCHVCYYMVNCAQMGGCKSTCGNIDEPVNNEASAYLQHPFCSMVTMVTIGGDLQPGCLADRLLTGLGQPQINP